MDFIGHWSERTEIGALQLVAWIGLSRSKFYFWRNRYGKANEHNVLVPPAIGFLQRITLTRNASRERQRESLAATSEQGVYGHLLPRVSVCTSMSPSQDAPIPPGTRSLSPIQLVFQTSSPPECKRQKAEHSGVTFRERCIARGPPPLRGSTPPPWDGRCATEDFLFGVSERAFLQESVRSWPR